MSNQGNCFTKNFRLITKSDFNNLRDGSRFLVSGVLLFYTKPNSFNHGRLGVAVSKKIGNAIKRNRVKRILRDVYRRSEFKNLNFDILVALNFKEINRNTLSFDDVNNQLADCLKEGFRKIEKKFGDI